MQDTVFFPVTEKQIFTVRQSQTACNSYLHCTPAQPHHLKQHHVFHAILLVVAIYPTCSLPSFAFLPCCLLPLLPTLEQNKRL